VKKILTVIVVLITPVLLVLLVTRSAAASAEARAVGPYPPGTLAGPTSAKAAAAECLTGTQASGAEYLICTPDDWEAGDDLLVYAHGYMAPNRPIEIPQDQMVIDGISVSETVTLLGYAFAATSYSENGLAVLPAIADLLDLIDVFTTTVGIPRHVYLTGVSEGGLITALSVEQHPDVYDGGLAMCGPYGDFQGQVNHFGDFRVVFDYLFPDLMPHTPITMPTSFFSEWETGYFSEIIEPEVEAPENAGKVDQLLAVTEVSPYTYGPPTSTQSIRELLQYSVYATQDGREKLDGQPFDNRDPYRWYRGSDDDQALNDEVQRFSADSEAVDAIEAHYQTTGELTAPLVTLHTTGDPVVPYWHATRYWGKVIAADNTALHKHFRVVGHGHCAFSFPQIWEAFSQLVTMVEDPPPYEPVRRAYLPLVYGAPVPAVAGGR
jgi:pimeloyl-ACP methyl ester carboxylesterase